MSADAPRHGSLTDEAARLIEALESALFHGRSAPAPGRWLSDLISDFEANGSELHSEDCRYCPVCRAISAVRGIRPEALEHLRDAGASLIAALRLATENHTAAPETAADVIDLDAPAPDADDVETKSERTAEPGLQHIPIF
jgi:hypothetical protein